MAAAEAYVFFYSNSSWASQWYPCEFTEDDVKFNCAEQYMMYHKAILFGDVKTAESILKTKYPAVAKRLGRKVSGFDEKTWSAKREDIVLRGNTLKFGQNEKLKVLLIAHPKGTTFVEASPHDKIWGIGFSAENALKNKDKWGLNLLGKAITAVRNDM